MALENGDRHPEQSYDSVEVHDGVNKGSTKETYIEWKQLGTQSIRVAIGMRIKLVVALQTS